MSRPTIGWIGLGPMGAPLAAHVAGSFPLVVWSRSGRGLDVVAEADVVADATALAGAADIVVTMLSGPADVAEVWRTLLDAARPGQVFIDLTTSAAELARTLAEEAANRGARALDAPVTGGRKGALDGAVTLMVGGEHQALDAVRPVLACFARAIHLMGPAGSGQRAKAVNQIAVAGIMRGLAEALALAKAADLDADAMLDVLDGGTARSFLQATYARKMWVGDTSPGFSVRLFEKDLGLAEDMARTLGLDLDGTAATRRLYAALDSEGRGGDGIQALIDVIIKH